MSGIAFQSGIAPGKGFSSRNRTMTSGGGSPTGITIDPANVSDIWIVDNATDRVYQFTASASRTSGSQSPATSFALAAGNTNPQGIADPPPSAPGSPVGWAAAVEAYAPQPVRRAEAHASTSHLRSPAYSAAVDQLFGELDGAWTRKSKVKLHV